MPKRHDTDNGELYSVKEMRSSQRKTGQLGGGFHFPKGAVRSSSQRMGIHHHRESTDSVDS